jgi:hypothetical protein
VRGCWSESVPVTGSTRGDTVVTAERPPGKVALPWPIGLLSSGAAGGGTISGPLGAVATRWSSSTVAWSWANWVSRFGFPLAEGSPPPLACRGWRRGVCRWCTDWWPCRCAHCQGTPLVRDPWRREDVSDPPCTCGSPEWWVVWIWESSGCLMPDVRRSLVLTIISQ